MRKPGQDVVAQKVAVASDRISESEALVDALKRGDEAAFKTLVRRYAPRLYPVARRFTGNHQDAQDCLQEAFLQVHRKIDQFEGRAALGTWLHRIVINAALSAIRSRRDDEESLDALQPEFDRFNLLIGPTVEPPASAEDLLQRAGTRRAVRQAIDQLPASYRSVLLLRDIEGYDTRETAALLGIGVSAAKVRLHRARMALKALLEPLFREEGP